MYTNTNINGWTDTLCFCGALEEMERKKGGEGRGRECGMRNKD